MICKKIPNPKKSSSKSVRASELVLYITATEKFNSEEKCIFSEALNFFSSQLKSQTLEMISLSQEAVKSKDPIDHWVLSWKAHERPAPAQAQEAAAIFMKQCGLIGHQHIIGLHVDTGNMHLHIAVNRVHPYTCKVVKINNGFYKEAGLQAIAIIEKIQGWRVELNARYRANDKAELVMDPVTKRPRIFEAVEKVLQPTTKARAMEIQTGEKSAQRVGIEYAAPILAKATSWKDLHAEMAAVGMQFLRKGGGAVVKVDDVLVKASNVDRKASLPALQKRLGPYQPSQEIKPNKEGNGSGIFHQRLNDQQTGWEQYQQIKSDNDGTKSAERLALHKRHDDERAKLSDKLMAERADIFSGDWTGKGEAKNLLQSFTATQQAAEKLKLQECQRIEKKALQAKYKPLPMYKQWKEQSLIVAPVNTRHIELRELEIKVLQTLRALTSTVDQYNHVTYQLGRKDVFRNEGRTIQILDLKSDEGIAAALVIAQQKFGNVLTLTGSLKFQHNAVAMVVANNLTCRFSEPALDKLREQLQQGKNQTELDTARIEPDRAAAAAAAAAQLEKFKALRKLLYTPPAVPNPTNLRCGLTRVVQSSDLGGTSITPK